MSREELVNLLDEDIDVNKDLYIWGTGNTASLYQEGLRRLEAEGIIIHGYVDNNSAKWGTTFGNNKPVISPQELIEKNANVLLLVASPQPKIIKSIGQQIDSLGLVWKHIDDFIFKTHKKEVLMCYDLMEDEESKAIYAELVLCRMLGKYPKDEFVDKEQYFSFGDFGDYDTKEVFVDCGAFVGDSIERYLGRKDGTFGKIIAFEPDKANFRAMGYRLERLKREWNLADSRFEIYPYGISDINSVSYVERYEANNGFGTKLSNNATEDAEEIKIISIDGFIKEKYTFLKADIESYEYKLLEGARNSIVEYQPKMAICIYHNAVDFYSIPLLINEINPQYKLAIRHYTHVLSESVLYAYISSEED